MLNTINALKIYLIFNVFYAVKLPDNHYLDMIYANLCYFVCCIEKQPASSVP